MKRVRYLRDKKGRIAARIFRDDNGWIRAVIVADNTNPPLYHAFLGGKLSGNGELQDAERIAKNECDGWSMP
jgi:hypothetical protein